MQRYTTCITSLTIAALLVTTWLIAGCEETEQSPVAPSHQASLAPLAESTKEYSALMIMPAGLVVYIDAPENVPPFDGVAGEILCADGILEVDSSEIYFAVAGDAFDLKSFVDSLAVEFSADSDRLSLIDLVEDVKWKQQDGAVIWQPQKNSYVSKVVGNCIYTITLAEVTLPEVTTALTNLGIDFLVNPRVTAGKGLKDAVS